MAKPEFTKEDAPSHFELILFLSNIHVNRYIPFFMMASYIYYKLDEENIFPDQTFDYLCNMIYDHWYDIDHPHKELITKDDLLAGTGFNIQFPDRVKYAALHWKKDGFPLYK